MLIPLQREKHLDYIGFETLHFVQGDNQRNFSEASHIIELKKSKQIE